VGAKKGEELFHVWKVSSIEGQKKGTPVHPRKGGKNVYSRKSCAVAEGESNTLLGKSKGKPSKKEKRSLGPARVIKGKARRQGDGKKKLVVAREGERETRYLRRGGGGLSHSQEKKHHSLLDSKKKAGGVASVLSRTLSSYPRGTGIGGKRC